MTKTGEAARPTPTIEPETFAETWLLYQKQIIIGAIVIAAAGGGVWMWRRSGQIKEEKASEAFQVAEASYMGGNQALAVTELEKIVGRYKGTTEFLGRTGVRPCPPPCGGRTSIGVGCRRNVTPPVRETKTATTDRRDRDEHRHRMSITAGAGIDLSS